MDEWEGDINADHPLCFEFSSRHDFLKKVRTSSTTVHLEYILKNTHSKVGILVFGRNNGDKRLAHMPEEAI